MGDAGVWVSELEVDASEIQEARAALELNSWRRRPAGEDPVVTTVEGRPWIHVHRLFALDWVERKGWGVAELVCHACDAGTYVAHLAVNRMVGPVPVGPQAVRDMIIRFTALHGPCDAEGRGKLHRGRCNSMRSRVRVIDLRVFAEEASRG